MPKILTIKDFSNVADNGIFWMQGFSAQKVNSKSVLAPRYVSNKRISNTTSGFTNLTVFDGATRVKNSANSGNIVSINRTGKLFNFHTVSTSSDIGEIHSIETSGTSLYAPYSDVYTTKDGNLLYSARNFLGYGVRGQCKTTSATTIVDKDGRNFTTFGLGTTAGKNKVYNLTTKEEFTITSITTTDSTDDTLNFSAGSSTNTANDYFMVFADRGAANGGANWNFFTSTAYPQFKDEEAESSFRRQIVQFDTDYVVGNGNFLAALNVDETTWNDNFKQLPQNTSFRCMDVNQDRILVGGDVNGKGKLCLWDGFSDGWLSIIELERAPQAIKSYDSGWLIFLIDTIYFTNGYQIKKIDHLPDTEDMDISFDVRYNSLLTMPDRFLLNLTSNINNRIKSGIYTYEFGRGWVFSPHYTGDSYPVYNVTSGAIFSSEASGVYRILFSGAASGATQSSYVDSITDSRSDSNRVVFFLSFDNKINVKQIELKMSYLFKNAFDTTEQSCNITVNVGQGHKPFWRLADVTSAASTTSITVDGTTFRNKGSVGSLIEVLDGDLGGERTYITSIANAGASNETWTVSPALSATLSGGEKLNIYPLVKSRTMTVSPTDLFDVLKFPVSSIYADSMYVEVFTDTSSLIQIDNLDLYAD